jgi:hypothetical protein
MIRKTHNRENTYLEKHRNMVINSLFGYLSEDQTSVGSDENLSYSVCREKPHWTRTTFHNPFQKEIQENTSEKITCLDYASNNST